MRLEILSVLKPAHILLSGEILFTLFGFIPLFFLITELFLTHFDNIKYIIIDNIFEYQEMTLLIL